jgi:hypothetical protein
MVINRALSAVRVDFAPAAPHPSVLRVVGATVLAIGGSLAADALLVVLGERVFPSTKGYVHFQFADYAKLTIPGVVVACVAWPIVSRISSTPRWLYARLAVLVTIVLLLPDVWLLHQGQSAQAVAVLMTMHIAIALVTYFAMTRLAPSKNQGVNGT